MTFSFFLCRVRWRLHRYILGRRKTIKRLNIHLGPKKSVKQKRPFFIVIEIYVWTKNKKNKLQLLLSSAANSEAMKIFDCFQQYLLLCSKLDLEMSTEISFLFWYLPTIINTLPICRIRWCLDDRLLILLFLLQFQVRINISCH